MVQHITAPNSVFTTVGDAFASFGPDTNLLVDADAFLITTASIGIGANVSGASWTVTINGAVASLGNAGEGLRVSVGSLTASKVTIGSSGDVSGGDFGLRFSGVGSIINKGTISSLITAARIDLSGAVTLNNSGLIEGPLTAIELTGFGSFTLKNGGTIIGDIEGNSSNVPMKISSSGLIDGEFLLGGGADIVTNFVKTGKIIKSGTVTGMIDVGAGDDIFRGGKNAESVRDGSGQDSYNFGKGNDTLLAVKIDGSVDGADIVNGGAGVDTYQAGSSFVLINLDIVDHVSSFGVPAQSASGPEVGNDTVISFENVNGSGQDDTIFGSSGANELTGNGGSDGLFGLGGSDILAGGSGVDFLIGGSGRDIMTGGPSGSSELDIFVFTKLSDSGVKASTRDLITDFVASGPDADSIDLAQIDANGNAAGEGAFGFIGFNQFSGTRGELRAAFSGGNTIVSGDVNGDGKADFAIALNGHLLLDGADFNL